MRRGQRRSRQLAPVSDEHDQPGGQARRAPSASPVPSGSSGAGPLATAASALQHADAAVGDAAGTVRVAEAQLDEALAAAPRLSPAVAAAGQARDTARTAAQQRSVAVHAAERTVADRAGTLRAAQAAYDELTDETPPAKVIAAEERVERAARAHAAAQETLLLAQEARETADHELAAAEEHLDHTSAVPARESSKVVAAREKLAKAQRDHETAQQRAAAAHAAYQRAAELEAGATDAGSGVTPLFASLDTFVDQYVLPNWRHPHDRSTYWCAQWWRHEEAVTRLETMWEAFEAMRREPAPSLSTWIRDHFDHHMHALTHANGPFARCDAKQHVHEPGPIWAHEDPGAGVFDVDEDAAVQPRRDQHTDQDGRAS